MKRVMKLGIAVPLILFLLWGVLPPAQQKAAAGATTKKPKALYVITDLRDKEWYTEDYQKTKALLESYGFEVDFMRMYDDNGTIGWPHYDLRMKLTENEYNIFIVETTGNNISYALGLPSRIEEDLPRDTPWWYDQEIDYLGYGHHFSDPYYINYRGEKEERFHFAPNSIVILLGACYSSGLDHVDFEPNAPVVPDETVVERINNYSNTFINPQTRTTQYMAWVSAYSLLKPILENPDKPISSLAVPEKENAQLLTGRHRHYSGEKPWLKDVIYRKNKFCQGKDNREIWHTPAWVGLPNQTIKDCLGGVVPGDHNGDGDNTDEGEPNYKEPTPTQNRDFFGWGNEDLNFFPFLCLVNPNNKAAQTKITFNDEGGEYLTIQREVPANARITLNLNANPYLQNKNLSIEIQSLNGVTVLAERPMYFRYYGWMDGGSTAFGSHGDETSTSWFFAEGYTNEEAPFHEWICLANFNDSETKGKMTLLKVGGEKPQTIDFSLPPNSRQTYHINDYYQGEVSIQVDTDKPIVAERSMYFRYYSRNGFYADGGHTKRGVSSPSKNWYFAEGYVANNFEEWIAIANPNNTAGKATLTFYTPQGVFAQREIGLPANSRQTFYVNDLFSFASDVSVKVDATLPIVCERPMYFFYNNIYEDGHVSSGVKELKKEWYFAEGSTFPGFDTYILLANPANTSIVADLTYFVGTAAPITKTVEIPAQSRVTVRVNDDMLIYTGSWQADIGVKITSKHEFVAERTMYFDFGRNATGKERIRGGHVSVGNTPATEWLFAEAYTGY